MSGRSIFGLFLVEGWSCLEKELRLVVVFSRSHIRGPLWSSFWRRFYNDGFCSLLLVPAASEVRKLSLFIVSVLVAIVPGNSARGGSWADVHTAIAYGVGGAQRVIECARKPFALPSGQAHASQFRCVQTMESAERTPWPVLQALRKAPGAPNACHSRSGGRELSRPAFSIGSKEPLLDSFCLRFGCRDLPRHCLC